VLAASDNRAAWLQLSAKSIRNMGISARATATSTKSHGACARLKAALAKGNVMAMISSSATPSAPVHPAQDEHTVMFGDLWDG